MIKGFNSTGSNFFTKEIVKERTPMKRPQTSTQQEI
jgi:hypothetical protein